MGTSKPNVLTAYGVRFSPGLVPTLAALLGIAVTGYLGAWQQGRAAEKRQLQQTFDARTKTQPLILSNELLAPDEALYRQAVASGEFDAEGQLLVDNKSHESVVGYHVITPLRLRSTDKWLLVNRGWVARSRDYPKTPQVAVPRGEVVVEGMLSIPSTKFLELSKDVVSANVWQNLTIERYRQVSGRTIQPMVLLANVGASGLVPIEERPDARVEKHVEYMLTWYSLAATIVVLWTVLNLKISRKDRSE